MKWVVTVGATDCKQFHIAESTTQNGSNSVSRTGC